MAHRSPLGSLTYSVLAQCIGFVAGLGAVRLLPNVGGEILVLPIAVHGIVAAALTRWLSLGTVWQVLNLILPVAIITSAHVVIPTWALGVIAGILVLTYLPTLISGVPYYPTSEAMYRAVEKSLPKTSAGAERMKFIDLGCGFGGLLRYLARARPDDHFSGVEIGVVPYLISAILCAPFRNISISFRSMWGLNLSEFNVVYAFLAPGPMPRLWEKVDSEMGAGTTFITNSFPVPSEASETITIGEGRQSVLYIHRR